MIGPSNPHVASQLRHLIYYNLDNGNWRNALFLAERLKAYDPRSQDSVHLLALCYLRLGQHHNAYDQAKPFGYKGSHFGCAYVFAEAARVRGSPMEGVHALNKCKSSWQDKNHWGTYWAPSVHSRS